jgi:hypothetical protein
MNIESLNVETVVVDLDAEETMLDLSGALAGAEDLDDETETLAQTEPEHDMSDAHCVFMLTSLLDSGRAQEAAQRLYTSSLGGLRFSSELNRTIPRGRAGAERRIH